MKLKRGRCWRSHQRGPGIQYVHTSAGCTRQDLSPRQPARSETSPPPPCFLRFCLKSGLTCFAIAPRTCRSVITADAGVLSSTSLQPRDVCARDRASNMDSTLLLPSPLRFCLRALGSWVVQGPMQRSRYRMRRPHRHAGLCLSLFGRYVNVSPGILAKPSVMRVLF